ncbi:MAG: lysophospholipid acyltransferase family protein [Erythrobacter sp.]|nr:lysophospholipid acyltransferase family protein [Erythrobacter sp.]
MRASDIAAALRSFVFYPLFYGVSVLIVLAAMLAIPSGHMALRKMVARWGRWHLWCVNHVLGIRVVQEGTIPEEPVLVAIKHESFFEAIDMPRLFAYPAVFAKRELFQIPGWGLVARTYGLIPVAREKGALALRQMVATARTRAGEGRVLVIFPEGTRIAHGDTPALQSGFAGIYKLLGLPIIPVAVDSGPLYQRAVKRSGTITYRVGERIPAGLGRPEMERRVHQAINALNAPERLPPRGEVPLGA